MGIGALTIEKYHQKSALIDSILASNAKIFVGGQSMDPTNKAKFIPHLVKGLSPLEFLDLMQNTFGSDVVTHEDLREFKLDIEKMLLHFTNHLVDMIKYQNNELFNRFIEYNKDGTFRLFEVFYKKLVSGRLNHSDIVASGLTGRFADLFSHYLKQLSRVPEHNYKGEITIHPLSFGDIKHPVLETKENFMVLLDILIMQVVCEYYTDKKYFGEDEVIQDSINVMREALFKLFYYLPHTRGGISSGPISEKSVIEKKMSHIYLVNKWRNSKEGFEEIKRLMQHSYTTQEMAGLLNSLCVKNAYDNGMCFDDTLGYSEMFYFDILVELMGYLNCFEQMYLKLKEQAVLNDSETNNGESVKFTMLLNEHNLNILPIIKFNDSEDSRSL
ncbi:hypothetical protein [Acinetobacter sp. YH12126]|uniref:hypothetical protein n=1 Tax=Acinetobacter sp. YH12126 TaxID=2601111 RepID=UPI0015D44FC0|nr:hypothetical protein [Acinetobacter sp. YH12126]